MSEPTSTPEPNSGDRPRYGEYAPPGWTPPQQAQPAAAEPVGATPVEPSGRPDPGTPSAPPAHTAYPAAQQGGWNATPTSGYAPGGWGDPAAPAERPRRTADVVFTIILLVVGLLGMLYGVVTGLALSNPEALESQLRDTYGGDPQLTVGAWPWVVVAGNIVLYALALILSVRRMLRRRITFWVPLVAGVAAFVLFVVAALAIAFSDPSFLESLSGNR